MNTKLVSTLLLMGFLGAANAQSSSADTTSATMVSPAARPAATANQAVSRKEVLAELERARANGELAVADTKLPYTPPSPASTLTRQDVLNELAQARASGELARIEAEYQR